MVWYVPPPAPPVPPSCPPPVPPPPPEPPPPPLPPPPVPPPPPPPPLLPLPVPPLVPPDECPSPRPQAPATTATTTTADSQRPIERMEPPAAVESRRHATRRWEKVFTGRRNRGPPAASTPGPRVLRNSTVNADACYRAVQTRDARFAGRFFLGVRTTRIYCRPGCPARLPRRENVEFFPSAAAAEGAGFRACLRCRPDAAPGSPVQAGTAATLSRALRLLEESGETRGLADRLGVTDRHLRRLFARHLGATAAAVLRTRRLHLARQLLESSALPMIDVAHAAGFRSVRRFNEAIKRGFGRTPSALRKEAGPRAALTLRLAFHAPLDFEKLLEFFAQRALPG